MDHEGRPIEIKDLNKTQLILLAILISFVVSIATGITTVTLMQQAPTAVTQPISRVVQHTIEKVVPNYVPGKTQTIIVKEDDLVVDAVQKTRSNIYPIFLSRDATISLADAYSVGGGNFIAVSPDISKESVYLIKVGDVYLPMKVLGVSPYGVAVLSPTSGSNVPKDLPNAVFGRDSDVKTGQTLVSIGSEGIIRGLVQAVIQKDEKDANDKVIASWHIFILDKFFSKDMLGMLAVNLDGSVVGVVVPKGEGAQILGVDAVAKFISDTLKPAN